MKEDFLYYIWMHHLRLNVKYITTQGVGFIVLDKGIRNTDAGADISLAKIKMQELEWCGSVEFHLKASDWERHAHHRDAAYNNVILHFVAEDDKQVYTKEGRGLAHFVFPKLQELYELFQNVFRAHDFIHCEPHFNVVDSFIKEMWLQRLNVERLKDKTESVFKMVHRNKGDWEETLYQILSRYLGQSLNGDAFEQLASRLPLSILAKHRNSLLQLEALLFGQAGMLNQRLYDILYKTAK